MQIPSTKITLTQDTLGNYFQLADNLNGWFDQITNTYDFVSRSSNCLVVTVGDSWTWGCDLTIGDRNNELRRELVFGNRLAKQLNADWLNLAIPAVGNWWIADRVEELAQIVDQLGYTRVILVTTFSEVGRGFNTHLDAGVDYVTWFNENIHSLQDFDRFLEWLNSQVVDRILAAINPHQQIQLLVGTSTVEARGLGGLQHINKLDKPWYQIAGVAGAAPTPTCADGLKGLLQIPEFLTTQEQHQLYKQWILELMPRAENRTEAFRRDPNLKNFHPGALGHQLWADYILQHVK